MKNQFIAFCLALMLLTVVMLTLPVGNIIAAGEDNIRDVITSTIVLNTGITQTLSAASGDGHKFVNSGKNIIVVNNTTGDTITMTIVTGGTYGGIALADVDVSIDNNDTALIGPFNGNVFNQLSGADAGYVYLNWNDEITGTVANSVTLAVYKVQ